MNLNLNLSQKSFNLILKFEYFSLFLSFIGSLFLYIHLKFFIDFILYEIGIKIFQAGLIAGIFSFCCGIFFNGISEHRGQS